MGAGFLYPDDRAPTLKKAPLTLQKCDAPENDKLLAEVEYQAKSAEGKLNMRP